MNKSFFRKAVLLSVIAVLCSTAAFAKKEKKPVDPDAMHVTHNEGVAFASVNRLQKKTGRSNFYWQDNMIGAFYAMQTVNVPLNIYGRIAAFYPVEYKFNEVPQTSKQVLLYAFDLFVGPIWTIDIKPAVRIQISPGFHTMYQLHDKAHYVNIGGGVLIGVEMPMTKGITLIVNGTFTYDDGNIGTNARMQPFDHCWSYCATLGVRFSKYPNKFYYIKSKADKAAAGESQPAQEKADNSAKK